MCSYFSHYALISCDSCSVHGACARRGRVGSRDWGRGPRPPSLHCCVQVVYSVKDQCDELKRSPKPKIERCMLQVLRACSRMRCTHRPMSRLLLNTFGKVTAVLSSVMGPTSRVDFAGHTIDALEFYTLCPIGLYYGFMSYNGQVSAGIVLDADVGDAAELAKHWVPAFEELEAAAAGYGAHGVPRTSRCRKNSVAPAPARVEDGFGSRGPSDMMPGQCDAEKPPPVALQNDEPVTEVAGPQSPDRDAVRPSAVAAQSGDAPPSEDSNPQPRASESWASKRTLRAQPIAEVAPQ